MPVILTAPEEIETGWRRRRQRRWRCSGHCRMARSVSSRGVRGRTARQPP